MTHTEIHHYRFIGEEGYLGYKRGQVYYLTIVIGGDTFPIVIVGTTTCPYSSLNAFMRNWEAA